jgi:hypothetical protein
MNQALRFALIIHSEDLAQQEVMSLVVGVEGVRKGPGVYLI